MRANAIKPTIDGRAGQLEHTPRDAFVPSDDAKRFAKGVEGIEEKIVWTTKDGKRWDSLEDAIAHQRKDKILDAIFDSEKTPEWIQAQAKNIADNAAALFAILEPFFRKGE